MTKSNWTSIWGALIGLFITIIGSSLLLAFQIGVMNEKIMSMVEDIPAIRSDIAEMKTELTEIKVKLDVLWRVHESKANSSLGLNNTDREALKKSRIEDLISDRYSEIVLAVQSLKPDDAQQVEDLLISVMNRYKKSNDCRQVIQEGAIISGYDVDSLLFVAALSIRDRVVKDLGF